MDMSMGMSEGMEMNTPSLPPKDLPHVVLQNGGYGNIVYNLMFLLQIRLTKYFNGGKSLFLICFMCFIEDFNDEQFSHYFFKLYDMLSKQEQII